MGFFSKVADSIGGLLNDITGTSSAAAQSHKYAKEMAELNNKYQKEFAQNAHQWEVEDLKKAGINPILTATGGSGASASGGGASAASMSPSGINPIDSLIGTINGVQSARQVSTQIRNTDADTLNKNIDSQIKYVQYLVDSGSSKYKIDQAKQELENMRKTGKILDSQERKVKMDIVNTIEDVKKKRGGKVTDVIGTDPGETVKNTGKSIANFFGWR